MCREMPPVSAQEHFKDKDKESREQGSHHRPETRLKSL